MKKIIILLIIPIFSFAGTHPSKPWIDINYPQDKHKLWWNDDWWNDGQLETPQNHEIAISELFYQDDDVEVPAYLFKPKKPGQYPPILFQHGRRGLDDLIIMRIKRLAARGFIVLAPDLFNAYFKESYPLEHDYKYEKHVAKGIDILLQQKDIMGNKACVVSHTRGGYYTLKALVKYQKQQQAICYVSYYPHWQDPNAPEPMQIYQYAQELEQLNVPVLVFFGEHEQYQRMRPIIAGINLLQEKGGDARLIIYPGVGRAFDFRPPHVRTFADDLAAKDASKRTAEFINKHLRPLHQ